jgi:hypothetical protein
MLRKSFPIIVSAGLACLMSGPYSLAQSTSTSGSGSTVTPEPGSPPRTVMMPVVFKLQLDPTDMARMAKMMHSGHAGCLVEDLNPDDDSSMIVICGLPMSTVSFQP